MVPLISTPHFFLKKPLVTYIRSQLFFHMISVTLSSWCRHFLQIQTVTYGLLFLQSNITLKTHLDNASYISRIHAWFQSTFRIPRCADNLFFVTFLWTISKKLVNIFKNHFHSLQLHIYKAVSRQSVKLHTLIVKVLPMLIERTFKHILILNWLVSSWPNTRQEVPLHDCAAGHLGSDGVLRNRRRRRHIRWRYHRGCLGWFSCSFGGDTISYLLTHVEPLLLLDQSLRHKAFSI